MTQKNERGGRLNKDEWLAQALDILALEGRAKLRIDAICSALGVTKGSFYWHFKNRDDFVRSVVEFWSARFTEPIIAQVAQMDGTARGRLEALMHTVSEGGFARYDVSIRAWAAQDPDLVAEIVKTVDRRRLAFARSLFTEMGFKAQESEMRARACIAYLIYEAAVLIKSPARERSKLIEQFLQVIT